MMRNLMDLVLAAADAAEKGKPLKVSPEEFNILKSTPVEEWDALAGAIIPNYQRGDGAKVEVEWQGGWDGEGVRQPRL